MAGYKDDFVRWTDGKLYCSTHFATTERRWTDVADWDRSVVDVPVQCVECEEPQEGPVRIREARPTGP